VRNITKTASLVLGSCLLSLAASPVALAITPGVDIAVPRVAITTAGQGGNIFSPSSIRIEPDDWVRWRWALGLHTTTSGASCVSNGLWNSNLNSTTTQFERQFTGAPGSFPFFCMPHCSLGMVGTVLVTSTINLDLTDVAPMAVLTWTGGGGLYRIFRADNPLFNTATVLTPPQGINTTGFNDTTGDLPVEGTAFFYLVMNQF